MLDLPLNISALDSGRQDAKTWAGAVTIALREGFASFGISEIEEKLCQANAVLTK